MGDDDLIRRGDALAACAPHYQATLRALPAAPAEDVRAGALREAAAICDDLSVGYAKHKGAPMALADAKRDILALIPEAKP